MVLSPLPHPPRSCAAGPAAALHAPGGRWPRDFHALHAVVALAAQRECRLLPSCRPRYVSFAPVKLGPSEPACAARPLYRFSPEILLPPLLLPRHCRLQAAQALYLATSAGAAAWSPLLAYPFLDMAHISLSQHGPLLMGVSDVLTRATSVAAVWAMLRNGHGATDTAGFEAAGVVGLRDCKGCAVGGWCSGSILGWAGNLAARACLPPCNGADSAQHV